MPAGVLTNELLIRITVAHRRAAAAIDNVTARMRTFRQGVTALNRAMVHHTGRAKNSILWILKLGAAYLVLRGIRQVGKDMIWGAAKIDLMADAVKHLWTNLKLPTVYLQQLTNQVRALGITTEDTINTISAFTKTGLDITKLAELARGAQDAAVISGKTTSETLKGLVNGIVTLQTRVLRTHGVYVNINQAIRDFAAAQGKSIKEMSAAEKQAAVLARTLEYLSQLQGTYENSLKKVGKQILQLDRLWREAKLAMGEFGQAVLTLVIVDLTALLNKIEVLKKEGDLKEWGKGVSDTLVSIYNVIKTSLTYLWEYRKALWSIFLVMKGFAIVKWVVGLFVGLNAAIVAMTGHTIVRSIALTQTLTTELGLLGAAAFSTADKITILGTSFVALGTGFIIGKIIGSSDMLREAVIGNLYEMTDALDNWGKKVSEVSNITQKEWDKSREGVRESFSGMSDIFLDKIPRVFGQMTGKGASAFSKLAKMYINYVDDLWFGWWKLEAMEKRVAIAQKKQTDERIKQYKKLGVIGISTMKEFNEAIKNHTVVYDQETNKWINLTMVELEAEVRATQQREKNYVQNTKSLVAYSKEIDKLGQRYLKVATTNFSDVLKNEKSTLQDITKELVSYQEQINRTFEDRKEFYLAVITDLANVQTQQEEIHKQTVAMAESEIKEYELLLTSYRNYYKGLKDLRDAHNKTVKDSIKDLAKFEKDSLETKGELARLIENEWIMSTKYEDMLSVVETAQNRHYRTVTALDRQYTDALKLTGKEKMQALQDYIENLAQLADEQESISTGFPPEGIGIISDAALELMKRAQTEWENTRKTIKKTMQEAAQKSEEASKRIQEAMYDAEDEIAILVEEIEYLQIALDSLKAEILITVDDQATPGIEAIQAHLNLLQDKTITITTRHVNEYVGGGGNNTEGSFKKGIDYVPRDMNVRVHKGERITSADQNPSNPFNVNNYDQRQFTLNEYGETSKINSIEMEYRLRLLAQDKPSFIP